MLAITLIIISLLGLAIGSFLNVLILRSIEGKSLSGRSQCPHCHHLLETKDLIPLFSFLILRVKCRFCHKKISAQYPLVEGITAGLFLLAAFLLLSQFNQNLNLHSFFMMAIQLFGIGILLAVFVTDLRVGLIPNRIIVPGLLGLLALKIFYILSLLVVTYFTLLQDPNGVGKYLLPPYSAYLFTLLSRFGLNLLNDVLMGFGIGLIFYILIVITKGRAMGGGDIKLGAFVGLLNGWPLSLVALLIAFTSGAVVSIGLLLLGKKKFGQTVPFGPFLVLGSIITLFWGSPIFNWYLNLIG